MNYKTIKRRSTSELVLKEILGSIQSGELKPGDKLPTESKLSEMFGVGRSSLREALSALALMGYIEVTQGRGSFVRQDLHASNLSAFALKDIQTAASLIDILEVREILECSTARLASGRATAGDIRRLWAIFNRMKENMGNIEQFSENDFDFHVALAEASGNEMLLVMMKFIVQKVHQAYVKLKHETLFEADEAIATAEKVIAGIAGGRGDAAADAMRDHLNLVTTELKRMISDKKRMPGSGRVSGA